MSFLVFDKKAMENQKKARIYLFQSYAGYWVTEVSSRDNKTAVVGLTGLWDTSASPHLSLSLFIW